MSKSRNDRVGQKISSYRLIRFIGHGGFADVYLGEHIYLKTLAAVKILHTQTEAADRSDILKEARTIAQLEHPHIIRLFEYGVDDGYPFLIMSYAAHGSLRNYYPRGSRLPAALVISYVQQMASALDYAHKNKLIHRDVKPENMLVGQNDQLLLSDFGLVLMAQTSRSQASDDLAGTVAYMAPEQLRGRPRFASDQYALGVVVYEWLCGKRPFNGSFGEIASQHMLESPPSLCAIEPGLAPEVEQVVFRALAKNSADRFERVGDFARALCLAYGSMSEFTIKSSFLATPPVNSQAFKPHSSNVGSSPDQSVATLSSPNPDPGETVEIPVEEAITSIYDAETGSPTDTAQAIGGQSNKQAGLLSSATKTVTPDTTMQTLRLPPFIGATRTVRAVHNKRIHNVLFMLVLLLLIGSSVVLGFSQMANRQGTSVQPMPAHVRPSAIATHDTIERTSTVRARRPTSAPSAATHSTPASVPAATQPPVLQKLIPAVPQTSSAATRVSAPTPTLAPAPTPLPAQNTPPPPEPTPTPDPDVAPTPTPVIIPTPDQGIVVPTLDTNMIPGFTQ